MDPTVIVAVITAVQAVGVAVIGGLFAVYTRRAEERADEVARKRDESDRMRQEIDSCMYDLVFATANAMEVLLHHAHGDHINGNVDEALESIKSAKAECNHLLNKNAARL